MLEKYVSGKQADAHQDALERIKQDIANHSHQSVWLEMQRSRTFFPQLVSLFEKAPELLK